MGEQKPAATDAVLRVALLHGHALDQLDARPGAARVLPAAAGAAEPFAENRAGRDQPALLFLERPGQRLRLTGGPHADGDEAGKQVRRDRQARALRNVVDVAHDLQTETGADQPGEQIGQMLLRALEPRRHDPRRDHGRLQQTEIIAGKVEHLGQAREIRRGAQIGAHQRSSTGSSMTRRNASTGGRGSASRP